uniref:Uncharacterized protein n=1 Tax=Leersia perrieri TaxID=77586 RepID=A0A0D9WXG9_9ORYZ
MLYKTYKIGFTIFEARGRLGRGSSEDDVGVDDRRRGCSRLQQTKRRRGRGDSDDVRGEAGDGQSAGGDHRKRRPAAAYEERQRSGQIKAKFRSI